MLSSLPFSANKPATLPTPYCERLMAKPSSKNFKSVFANLRNASSVPRFHLYLILQITLDQKTYHQKLPNLYVLTSIPAAPP